MKKKVRVDLADAAYAIERWIATQDEILQAVEKAVKKVIKTNNEEGRNGGYFCLNYYNNNRLIIPPTLVGTVTNGKSEKYIGYCEEKSQRLSVLYYRQASSYHLCSSESRNSKRGQYGGAILFGHGDRDILIFSFSGLSEAGDEAAMLLAAVELGYISMKDARKFARKSLIGDGAVFLAAVA